MDAMDTTVTDLGASFYFHLVHRHRVLNDK